MTKTAIFKVLKFFRVFDCAKQIKINWVTKHKRNTQIDCIDLSDLSPRESGIKHAETYGPETLSDLPTNYDKQVVEAYNILKGLDENLIVELDSIAENLGINKYLLLAKEFLYIPEGCTSITAKCSDGVFVGQNLDLGYSGSSLVIKKYKDYIVVGLKSHPLWATTGINIHGVTIGGSSVNSRKTCKNIIPSVFNPKLILSRCRNISDVMQLLSEHKFFVGHDASSYSVSDKKGIGYIECDSMELFHREELEYCFTVNRFIELKNNLYQDPLAIIDAIEREMFLERQRQDTATGFEFIKSILSSHSANICAHSSKSPRHTTCTIIIDKANRTLFFTKQLPCKVKSKQEFYAVHLHD